MSSISLSRERAMVVIMFATWGVVFLDRMSLLYPAPYIARDLRLGEAQIGVLAGVVAITWAISSVVFGAISDRIGQKTVLIPMAYYSRTRIGKRQRYLVGSTHAVEAANLSCTAGCEHGVLA